MVWRLGGGRAGARQTKTFSIGTDEQNLARAQGFKKMVEAAGGHWPEGWVKGEGFVRARGDDAYTPPPTFSMLGLEYVDRIVDLSPGQRRRYRDQMGVLARTEVRDDLPFTRMITAVKEHDIKAGLIDWDRALKTKANYHGLIYGVFASDVSGHSGQRTYGNVGPLFGFWVVLRGGPGGRPVGW